MLRVKSVAHTNAPNSSLLVLMAAIKKIQIKYHIVLLWIITGFLFLYFNRTCFDRTKQKKKFCFFGLRGTHSSFRLFLSFYLCASVCVSDCLCVSRVYNPLLCFDSFVIMICMIASCVFFGFIHSLVLLSVHTVCTIHILSFDWSQKTQWKMWCAAKAISLPIHIHESCFFPG